MAEINVKISEELKERLESKVKGTEFNSLEEYIKYILEKVTSEENNSNKEEAYTKEEEEAVKERLEGMGYI